MHLTIKLHLTSIAKLALGLWELSTVHTKHLYFSLVLVSYHPSLINSLKAELNPICHLLALWGAHHILHISRIRVNYTFIFFYHFSSHLQTKKYLWLWEYFVYLFSAVSKVTFTLFVIFEYSTMYLQGLQ